MKNLSLGLNIVLTIAVVVLYILHFNSQKTVTTTTPSVTEVISESTPLPKIVLDSTQARLPIAYVNIDTLNAKYKYIETVSKEAQKKVQAQQKKLEAEKVKVTEEYQIFMENYQAGYYKTQAEVEQRQQYFMEKQQDFTKKEYELQYSLEKEMAETNAKIMKNVSDYLAKYSKELNYSFILATGSASSVLFANDSLDITKPILDGLNADYTKKK